MVVVPLRESADAWDLVRGGLAVSTSGFLTIRGIAHSAAANNGGPVLIFTASADPDALATVRTLTALLKADLIRYEIHPVDGYSHLRDKYQVLVSGDAAIEPRAILCVNCGAMVDIRSILGLNEREEGDVRVLIIDSHRPYHLRNVNSDRIILQHDADDFDSTSLPVNVNFEDQWGNIPDEVSSDDDDDDDGSSGSDSESDLSDFIDDSEAPDGPRPSSRNRRTTSENSDGDDDNDVKDDADDEDDENASSRNDSQSEKSSVRKRARRGARAHDSVDERVESYLEDVEEDDVQFDDGPEDDDDDDEGGAIRKGSRKRKQLTSPDGSEKQKRKKRRARRKRQEQRRRALRGGEDLEAEERQRVQEYYANASLATSSACIGHGIAMLLRRANQDSLWMAILGMTSQYMTSCIDQSLYDNQMAFCREGIKALQPNASRNGSSSDGGGADGDEGGEGDTSAVQNVGYVPSCSGSALQRIAQSVELRLDLLRQWNLFESMQYSSYTATRLGTWRQTGRRRLLELLATLGIPLGDSKQQWCYMMQKNKIALEQHLRSAMSRFDLGDSFQFDSFVRTLPGHRGDISAADFVHAVTALLEVDDSRWHHHAAEAASPIDRFWRAYDALGSKNVKLLEDGLDLAIFVQKLTAEIGGDVIERRKFVPSGPFRYVFLRDETRKEFLTQPILLRRLALFLNLALLRQGAMDKPFIILSPDITRNVWIAVAATTSSQRNDFGQRFRKAAERNGSTLTYSGFDSSVCEIKDGQEIEFVRFLHDVM